MRMEATIPDSRGTTAVELADELGLSRSQLIDEALALFTKAVLEVRRGRRIVTVDPKGNEPDCEIATPTLTALEWAARPARIDVPAVELERVVGMVAAPKRPGAKLRQAARRRHG
jgi:hypothetical protein